ncbi:ribonuclease H-like domain-containing protein [Tanacetum coccineum]
MPVLQKDDYDTWAMEMEHYLEYIDNEVWKVIQNGNSRSESPKLMAVPKDHLRRFHGKDDAKRDLGKPSRQGKLRERYDRFQKTPITIGSLGAGVSDEMQITILRSFHCRTPRASQASIKHASLRKIVLIPLPFQSKTNCYSCLADEEVYKKTAGRPRVDGNMHVAFDKRKVECFNCHNTGHFARECKFKGSKEGQINWVEQTTDEELNHALMAFTVNNEVSMCSKLCLDSFNALQAKYDELQSEFGDQEAALVAITDSNSDGELGTVTDHSVNDDSIPIPSSEQVSISTQKTQPQVPKPQQTVDPSCAQHVKTPRQQIRTPKARELLLRAQGWFMLMLRLATPPGQLKQVLIKQITTLQTCTTKKRLDQPYTASNTIKTGRVNVNTGHGNVSSVSSAGTQFKSGASRFNTGKQHVNSGRMYVNSGTQNKSGGSRVNTGKQNVNTARVNRPVLSNQTSQAHLADIKIYPSGSVLLEEVKEYQWKSPLGKFDGKSDEGFLVGYSVNIADPNGFLLQLLSEKIATKKTHSPRQPSSTPISKSADDIMTFRKELDALALKHLGPVPTTVPTSTNPVNTGSSNLNTAFEEVNTGNTEAITPNFNNLPDEVDVPTNPTLRIHNAHPQSQILGDPNTPVQTRSSLKKITEAHALQELKLSGYKVVSFVWIAQALEHGIATLSTCLREAWRQECLGVEELEALMQQISNEFPKSKLPSTPMETSCLDKDEEAFYVDVHLYRFYKVTPKTSHLNAARGSSSTSRKTKLGIMEAKETTPELEAFSDSTMGGSNLGRKSTTVRVVNFLVKDSSPGNAKKQTK